MTRGDERGMDPDDVGVDPDDVGIEPSDVGIEPSDVGIEPSDLGLEARLRRLEAIVSALDSDAMDLEQALALFEEGVGHVKKAQAILAEAELKVEELIGRAGEDRRELPVDETGHE